MHKVVALVLLILVALASGCVRGTRNRDATHVVLISIDSLNQRQFATGIREGYTPVFAALAEDSLAFSRAYTHAPWTTPSHISMMTGLFPSQHGRTTPYRLMLASQGSTELVADYPALPETLAATGYETVAFAGQGPISARYGLGRGFGRFEESAKNADQSDLGETLEQLRGWLDQGGDAPFFLFVHTFDLHDPRPPARQDDREALAYIDRRIGELISMLKERGLYDGSLIVLTGDHGSEMIRTDGKCCIHGAGHYEENLKVPLLIKLPGSKLTGAADAIARHVDLFPTVADVIGLEIPGYRGPGVSLLDVASGDVASAYSFSEADGRCAMRFALVSSRYKYIVTPRGPAQSRLLAAPGFRDKYCVGPCKELPNREEFYDLEADPFEERDLLLDPLEPEQARELGAIRAAFADHRRLAAYFERRPGVGSDSLDPELAESLRQLGYVE
ncbi:MAG: sulfatase [Myxococcota bacterium]